MIYLQAKIDLYLFTKSKFVDADILQDERISPTEWCTTEFMADNFINRTSLTWPGI